MSLLRSLPALLVLGALLAGCGGAPELRPAPAQTDRYARTLLAEQRFHDAADEYLRLAAQASAPRAQAWRLAAADALLQAHDAAAARRVLAETAVEGLPAPLPLQRDVLLARVALAEGDAARALELLPQPPPGTAPAALASEARRTRAEALESDGRIVAAARERVALELLLEDADAIRRNRRELWRMLSTMPPAALASVEAQPPGTLSGWLRLASIAESHMDDPEALSQALEEWRRQYPGHPANEEIVGELTEASRAAAAPPAHVALLLPLEGRFAKAAEAIRDGFLAAWFADPDTAARPAVSVVDTGGGDALAAYREAVKDGADFVVGPLEKASVNRLAAAGALEVPTLALNHSDAEAAPPGEAAAPAETGARLYQFALSPEGEARRVAEHAWFQGYQRAAVIAPEGAWGDRVATAFREAWEHLGGIVVDSVRYPQDAPDMSAPVERLLQVDASEQRWRELREFLRRDIKLEPRRRKDLDFIFMAAFPRQARQLRPQFRFHQAEDVPVYATSHAYAGTPDPEADRDIDGVTVGDMPWVLDPSGADADLRRRIESAWPETFPAYLRLYAFGVDAYRLVPQLNRLRLQPYASLDGATGRLRVGPQERIERGLVWARFEDGVPQLAGAGGQLAGAAAR